MMAAAKKARVSVSQGFSKDVAHGWGGQKSTMNCLPVLQ